MKKKQLRKSDIKELNDILKANFGKELLGKDDKVEIVYAEKTMIIVNNQPRFFYLDDKIYPTLKYLLNEHLLKEVVVDMGAVKFVAGGADIMRPGIVDIDKDIMKGDACTVIDKNNRKPLAVCIALFSAAEISGMQTGKVLKNIHYVADKIWDFA